MNHKTFKERSAEKAREAARKMTITRQQQRALQRIMHWHGLGYITREEGSTIIHAYVNGPERKLFIEDVKALGGYILASASRKIGDDYYVTRADIPELLDYLIKNEIARDKERMLADKVTWIPLGTKGSYIEGGKQS